MFIIFTYNLTHIGVYKYAAYVPNSVRKAIAPTRVSTIGSINVFYNLSNLKMLETMFLASITGNIETAFANTYKLYGIQMSGLGYDPNSDYGDLNVNSTNISGNISVFGNKYNLEYIQIELYTNVNGQIKDMKNLKKLYWVKFLYCSVTGSKTDLWNQGANITSFNV